jgi:cell wall-associated NlpC family hydrolase
MAALLLLVTSLPLTQLATGDAFAKSTKKKGTLSATGLGLALDPSNPDLATVGGMLGVAPWLDLINQAADDAQAPWQVLAAIMAIESGGNPNALSAAGAVGLMQLMPASWSGLAQTYGANIWDPYTNIRTAAAILVAAKDKWGTWDQAAAAYFGALDAQGAITDARDAYGTTGPQYVERFTITLAAFGLGQSLDGLGQAGEAPASDAISAGLAYALQEQGVPYTYGGAAPAEGFDCSGLVYWAYGLAGLTLPRTAAEQWHATERVSAAEVQPGDLVFFAGTDGPDISHVGIYAGAGLLLDAPDVGQTVTLEPLNDPYWQAHLAGFGRVDPNYTPTEPVLPIATTPVAPTDGAAPSAVPGTAVDANPVAPADDTSQPAPSATPDASPTPDATAAPDVTATPDASATPAATETPAAEATPAPPEPTAPADATAPAATDTSASDASGAPSATPDTPETPATPADTPVSTPTS